MNTQDKDLKWYVEEFLSEECLCGRPKKPRFSFCYRCYKALPGDIQRRLYRMIGYGYEEAFEEGVKWLEQNVW